MNDLEDALAKLAAPVIQEAYSDAVSGALREAAKIGVDAVKTVRLALFPLQVAAALQDRLAGYIDRAVRSVPVERRIAPVESLASQIAERLRSQEEESPITDMYVRLLARAFDRERVGEAHPAFVHLIGQLAPDEVLIIRQLDGVSRAAYLKHKATGRPVHLEERTEFAARGQVRPAAGEELLRISLRPEELAQPDLFFTYVEHLVSLGIVVYTNDHPYADTQVALKTLGAECWFVELNQFGRLFHSACLGIT